MIFYLYLDNFFNSLFPTLLISENTRNNEVSSRLSSDFWRLLSDINRLLSWQKDYFRNIVILFLLRIRLESHLSRSGGSKFERLKQFYRYHPRQ